MKAWDTAGASLKGRSAPRCIRVCFSILSNCATIIADGIIVGRKIGTDGLTAISLCVPVYLILCVLGSLFVSGAFTAASNEIGRDNISAAQRYYGYALSLCLLSSVAAAAAGVFLSGGIAGLLCSDTAVYGMVLDYTRVTLIGALPKIMIYIPFWFLRLDGRNKTVTAMLAVMGGLNILLDVVFLIGMNMGIFGVALASVIATALACAEVFRVRQDTSSEYQHLCQAKGARMEQSKLIRVLTREDQIAFFNAARENG